MGDLSRSMGPSASISNVHGETVSTSGVYSVVSKLYSVLMLRNMTLTGDPQTSHATRSTPSTRKWRDAPRNSQRQIELRLTLQSSQNPTRKASSNLSDRLLFLTASNCNRQQ